MATYVLLHGAGGDRWYWHLVIPRLEALGHEAIAIDLPCDDDRAGLEDYVQAVVDAVGHRRDVVLVAQSLAGFTAPVVCTRLPVSLLVLVAAMVPRPGESAGAWWSDTGHVFPDPFDPGAVFTHDLPPEIAEQSAHHLRRQSDTFFADPWPLERWPDVPTRFVLCRDDRFFPADFMRRLVDERLGIEPDELGSGHLPALAQPGRLVELLERFRLEALSRQDETTA